MNGIRFIHDKKKEITNRMAAAVMAMCQRLLKYKGAIKYDQNFFKVQVTI